MPPNDPKVWTPTNKPSFGPPPAEIGVDGMPTSLGGIKLYKATELPEQGLCVGIYGEPGIGKTDLTRQAADSEYGSPLLIIDADAGAKTVSDRDDIIVAPVGTWDEVQAISKAIWALPNEPFKSISLDNMTDIYMQLKKKICGSGQPQIQDYGTFLDMMMNLTREWREYARKRGVNVFLVVWEDIDKDEFSKKTRFEVAFFRKLTMWWPGVLDIVGRMTTIEGGIRKLSFEKTSDSSSKFRKNRSKEAQAIPLNLYYGYEGKPLVDLLATLKGGKPFPTDKYKMPTPGPSTPQPPATRTPTSAVPATSTSTGTSTAKPQ